MKKPIQKQKNCSKFCSRASLHDHMFKLFFTLKAKFEFFPTAFAVILKPVALPIVPKVWKSWIQLRSNNVHYHFCFLSPKSCFKICDLSLQLTWKRYWSSFVCFFRCGCRKKTFLTRKFWGLCTHWSSILRPPKHWIVFFLSILKPKAVIYPC